MADDLVSSLTGLEQRVDDSSIVLRNSPIAVEDRLVPYLQEREQNFALSKRYSGLIGRGFVGFGVVAGLSAAVLGSPILGVFTALSFSPIAVIPFGFRQTYAFWHNVYEDALSEAIRLKEEGYVLVADLKSNLLPCSVDSIKAFSEGKRTWYAVRPVLEPDIPMVGLKDLSSHVGRPVIVLGKVSVPPAGYDMSLAAEADLELHGTVAGALPMSGRVQGQIRGSVYSPSLQFRVSDSSGETASVALGTYSAAIERVPAILKSGHAGSIDTFVASNNDARLFLMEANSTKKDVLLVGVPSPDRKFYAEAVLVRGSPEVYFIALHQEIPALEI